MLRPHDKDIIDVIIDKSHATTRGRENDVPQTPVNDYRRRDPCEAVPSARSGGTHIERDGIPDELRAHKIDEQQAIRRAIRDERRNSRHGNEDHLSSYGGNRLWDRRNDDGDDSCDALHRERHGPRYADDTGAWCEERWFAAEWPRELPSMGFAHTRVGMSYHERNRCDGICGGESREQQRRFSDTSDDSCSGYVYRSGATDITAPAGGVRRGFRQGSAHHDFVDGSSAPAMGDIHATHGGDSGGDGDGDDGGDRRVVYGRQGNRHVGRQSSLGVGHGGREPDRRQGRAHSRRNEDSPARSASGSSTVANTIFPYQGRGGDKRTAPDEAHDRAGYWRRERRPFDSRPLHPHGRADVTRDRSLHTTEQSEGASLSHPLLGNRPCEAARTFEEICTGTGDRPAWGKSSRDKSPPRGHGKDGIIVKKEALTAPGGDNTTGCRLVYVGGCEGGADGGGGGCKDRAVAPERWKAARGLSQ